MSPKSPQQSSQRHGGRWEPKGACPELKSPQSLRDWGHAPPDRKPIRTMNPAPRPQAPNTPLSGVLPTINPALRATDTNNSAPPGAPLLMQLVWSPQDRKAPQPPDEPTPQPWWRRWLRRLAARVTKVTKE